MNSDLVASRRELLGGALGGLAVTAAGPEAVALARPRGPSGGDSKQLSVLVGVERRLTAVYRRVLATGVLNVVVAAEVSGFAAQEREHLGALERELQLRGKRPRPPMPSLTSATIETQPDALNLLLVAESMAEASYLAAIAKLQDPGLVRLAAEIMASEAQHWTLLELLQNPQDLPGSVPVAFVTS